jgi:hypothetical protein
MKRKYIREYREQPMSHVVWNYHNPDDRIERGKGQHNAIIHHEDENRNNNHISNLQKMPNNEHSRMHHKGKKKSKEHIKKVAKANTGKKRSKEVRRNNSLAQIGNLNASGKRTEEFKKKMSIAAKGNTNAKGHILTKEARRKISIANKLAWKKRRAA